MTVCVRGESRTGEGVEGKGAPATQLFPPPLRIRPWSVRKYTNLHFSGHVMEVYILIVNKLVTSCKY